MKICIRCLIEQPTINYHKNSSSSDGFNNECKACKAGRRNVAAEMLASSRSRARRKGWENDLTSEAITALRVAQQDHCRYCGVTLNWAVVPSGKQRVCPPDRASLDRIDSTQGYTVGNVQLCCDFCNRFKYYYPESALLDYCTRVVAHNR